ncbi:MAG: DUF6754 domain-containing protein [Anaerolineaceae bacterium]|nr:DUF6754 domain-containing protein [Anaerolineaceae bacterium]
MSSIESMVGLGFVILATLLVVMLTLRQRRSGKTPVFRRIAAINRFKRAASLSVEEGTRIHVSLGNASLTHPVSASAFVSLEALHHIGAMSSSSDEPPIASSGDGALALLSQDILHQVARETNNLDLYNSDHGQLAGISPLSNVAGALQIIDDPSVKTNVLIGNFGAEAGLLSTASEERGSITLAASDSLPAQAVFFATTEKPLIGEELFALPAYLQADAVHCASLTTQDMLRGLVVLIILGGAILKILGVL